MKHLLHSALYPLSKIKKAFIVVALVSSDWCQMKTDGRGFCQGLGPAPGSCPWCEGFHLLVDVLQPDSSRPWIKMVWAWEDYGSKVLYLDGPAVPHHTECIIYYKY